MRNTDDLTQGIMWNMKKAYLGKENSNVKFISEKIDKEIISSNLKKINEISHKLNALGTRYYSYKPREFILEKEHVYTPLKEYSRLCDEQFNALLNDEILNKNDIKKLLEQSKILLEAVFLQGTEVRKEFENYQV